LAEHLTIDDGGAVKENGKSWLGRCFYWHFCFTIFWGFNLLHTNSDFFVNSDPFYMCGHVMWAPLTMAWCILMLQMKDTASRYGGYLRMCWIGSCIWPIRGGGSPSGGLGEVLRSPHQKTAYYKMLHRAS
jgi:hypothetical protein